MTGAGNPDWLASHPPAARTAPVVQRLVDAGASMAGKTHTDELSRGIFGENAHYGTPINPKAPDRVPGGSSSGSAAAVAGRLVDFALGTDTGGSVRVPASFCGLYGIRPTHGRLPFDGVMPQAPSFDTIGWFAREPQLLARIATVLLGIEPARTLPRRLVVAEDAFTIAEPTTRAALKPAVEKLGSLIGRVETRKLSSVPLLGLARASDAIQGREAWATFGEWIDRHNPRFGFEVADNILRGARIEELGRRGRHCIPRRAARRARPAARRRDNHLPSDRAVSGAIARPAAFGDVGEARPRHHAHLDRRDARHAATEHAARRGRQPAGRPVDHGPARQRRCAARRCVRYERSFAVFSLSA